MSRKAIATAVLVCLLLLLAGGGILGWLWVNRDKVAVASYKVEIGEDVDFSEVVKKEEALFKSDEVLKPVIEQLDLLGRWKMKSEDEALRRLRAKLQIKSVKDGHRVKLLYRDRTQKRALEVLGAINRRFALLRIEAARRKEMPPAIPVDPRTGQPQRPSDSPPPSP